MSSVKQTSESHIIVPVCTEMASHLSLLSIRMKRCGIDNIKQNRCSL